MNISKLSNVRQAKVEKSSTNPNLPLSSISNEKYRLKTTKASSESFARTNEIDNFFNNLSQSDRELIETVKGLNQSEVNLVDELIRAYFRWSKTVASQQWFALKIKRSLRTAHRNCRRLVLKKLLFVIKRGLKVTHESKINKRLFLPYLRPYLEPYLPVLADLPILEACSPRSNPGKPFPVLREKQNGVLIKYGYIYSLPGDVILRSNTSKGFEEGHRRNSTAHLTHGYRKKIKNTTPEPLKRDYRGLTAMPYALRYSPKELLIQANERLLQERKRLYGDEPSGFRSIATVAKAPGHEKALNREIARNPEISTTISGGETSEPKKVDMPFVRLYSASVDPCLKSDASVQSPGMDPRAHAGLRAYKQWQTAQKGTAGVPPEDIQREYEYYQSWKQEFLKQALKG